MKLNIRNPFFMKILLFQYLFLVECQWSDDIFFVPNRLCLSPLLDYHVRQFSIFSLLTSAKGSISEEIRGLVKNVILSLLLLPKNTQAWLNITKFSYTWFNICIHWTLVYKGPNSLTLAPSAVWFKQMTFTQFLYWSISEDFYTWFNTAN